MRIDLHVHTSERSGCATVNEEDQIRTAIQAGLDGIAITDHDRLVPRERLQALNERFAPFKIFTGIEVSADELRSFSNQLLRSARNDRELVEVLLSMKG